MHSSHTYTHTPSRPYETNWTMPNYFENLFQSKWPHIAYHNIHNAREWKSFSNENRIHTNDAIAWRSIGSNRASDRHKTTLRRRKKRWRKHRNQYQCNRVYFLSNVLFKSLLLLFLAFGSTLFCSSQLDMVLTAQVEKIEFI